MRFKWIVFVVGLVALSSFAFYGLFDRSDEVSHIVAPVTKIDMESLVLATGPIVATGLVDVGAQVNGQVKTIHVRLGDKVKKGQVLVEIDPELQENALSKAKASRDLVLAQQKAKEKRASAQRGYLPASKRCTRQMPAQKETLSKPRWSWKMPGLKSSF